MKTPSAFAVVAIAICGEVAVTLFGIAAAIAVIALAYMLLVDSPVPHQRLVAVIKAFQRKE